MNHRLWNVSVVFQSACFVCRGSNKKSKREMNQLQIRMIVKWREKRVTYAHNRERLHVKTKILRWIRMNVCNSFMFSIFSCMVWNFWALHFLEHSTNRIKRKPKLNNNIKVTPRMGERERAKEQKRRCWREPNKVQWPILDRVVLQLVVYIPAHNAHMKWNHTKHTVWVMLQLG